VVEKSPIQPAWLIAEILRSSIARIVLLCRSNKISKIAATEYAKDGPNLPHLCFYKSPYPNSTSSFLVVLVFIPFRVSRLNDCNIINVRDPSVSNGYAC